MTLPKRRDGDAVRVKRSPAVWIIKSQAQGGDGDGWRALDLSLGLHSRSACSFCKCRHGARLAACLASHCDWSACPQAARSDEG